MRISLRAFRCAFVVIHADVCRNPALRGTKLVTRDLLLERRRPGCRLVLGIGGHPTGEVNDAITATAQGCRRIPSGVRLIGVNSDNEPEAPDRIWKRLRSDLHPNNYLT